MSCYNLPNGTSPCIDATGGPTLGFFLFIFLVFYVFPRIALYQQKKRRYRLIMENLIS